MTLDQFKKLRIGDRVEHPFGGVGTVIYKHEMSYTLSDKGLSPNKAWDKWSKATFAWNEGELLTK